ncbi:MAG: DUF1573 domain-containing protein [Lentisphaeria bacterium]|nr:DUF1573 domain-containing protein [Lentisphaeria bacterium]NQZ69271.1 DUF1573 domain-containing protein [Lentisphaeria bacterium]
MKLLITYLLLSVYCIYANLKFDNNDKMLLANKKTMTVQARFEFVNMSSKTINIDKVSASCFCTTAKLTKRSYKPGERGTILASMRLIQGKGVQTKSIFVKTNEKNHSGYILKIRSEIPVFWKLSKNQLSWKFSKNNKKQVLFLKRLDSQAVISKFDYDKELFDINYTKEDDGHRFEITPLSTNKRISSQISFYGNLPVNKPFVYEVDLNVVLNPLEYFNVSKKHLVWENSNKVKSQTIEIQIKEGLPVKISKLNFYGNKNWNSKIIYNKRKNTFIIKLNPVDPSETTLVNMQIISNFPSDSPITIPVALQILPPAH